MRRRKEWASTSGRRSPTVQHVAPVLADREREKRLQRKASRAQGGGDWAKENPCKKWSKVYRKRARTLVRERRRNRVHNATHRLTTGIVRRFGLVAVERPAAFNREGGGVVQGDGVQPAEGGRAERGMRDAWLRAYCAR